MNNSHSVVLSVLVLKKKNENEGFNKYKESSISNSSGLLRFENSILHHLKRK